jgi:lipopolysaccharide biosynthesis protein
VGTGEHAGAIPHFRRPCPGFHPQIYAQESFAADEAHSKNPLADFIWKGRPPGPWSHEVIRPEEIPAPSAPEGIRAAIHGHFHYPELAADFVRKLSANQLRCDLLLTTNSKEKAEALSKQVSGYGRGALDIRLVPNSGRDIGAFLTAYNQDLLEDYDVVGHIHGKRSLATEEAMGERWREFAWQNLIGDVYPMADLILNRFAREGSLGLVFANDPHLVDWDGNKEIATDIARRMGLSLPLPRFFEFPVGTMFWARPKALKPLFDLGLRWEDYPKEPLPYDGTLLHALERLLPFAATRAGFRFATTHIPGITW